MVALRSLQLIELLIVQMLDRSGQIAWQDMSWR
jgi:hypothetical protein